jgi:type I restriction enzyme M protein
LHGIDSQYRLQRHLNRHYNEDAQFDVSLPTHPFTGNIDKGDINESLKLGTTKTSALLNTIFTMLKMGGTTTSGYYLNVCLVAEKLCRSP